MSAESTLIKFRLSRMVPIDKAILEALEAMPARSSAKRDYIVNLLRLGFTREQEATRKSKESSKAIAVEPPMEPPKAGPPVPPTDIALPRPPASGKYPRVAAMPAAVLPKSPVQPNPAPVLIEMAENGPGAAGSPSVPMRPVLEPIPEAPIDAGPGTRPGPDAANATERVGPGVNLFSGLAKRA